MVVGDLRAIVASVAFVAGVVPVLAETPTQAVMRFYDHVGLELEPAARSRFVDPAKTVLEENDRLRKSGSGTCLDPDMALDNVEGETAAIRKGLKTLEVIKGDEASVIVAFAAAGAPHRLEWKLKRVSGHWKIADLLSVTGEWALSQYHCE